MKKELLMLKYVLRNITCFLQILKVHFFSYKNCSSFNVDKIFSKVTGYHNMIASFYLKH